MAMETQIAMGHPKLHTTCVEPDKTIIPLVGHIITDDEMGPLQGAKLQPVNLSRVVKLLTDPHSAMLFDRHMHALKKVIKHYNVGFVMKDLVSVFKILNVCADRVEEHPLYIDPMLELLQLCSVPFLKQKSSDETAFEQIAVESVAQLGYLMRVPSPEIRHQICSTLVKFYCETPRKQQVQKHKANTLKYNQLIVENSDVSETLVKSLALLENDLDVRLAVLNVLQVLSKDSAANCDQMMNAEAALRLGSRLMDYDPSGQLLFRSLDILWNLLASSSRDEVASQLNNLTCTSQLRDAFIHQLTQGYSHYDRQLRNDLLVVCSLIVQCCPNTPFVETGFVKQLTLFASFQEVKSHNALVKHLKFQKNHEDFELKKLLINILVLLSHDSAVIPILSEGKLMLALFSYVKANEKVSAPRDWSLAQFEEIQLHAMAALSTLGPIMVEDYMMCQGSTRLLLMLEWCVGSDSFGGSGNAFHGCGGYRSKRAQMRFCLQVIRSMVSIGDEAVLQDFSDQGAVNQVVSILGSILGGDRTAEDAVDVEMQSDMLFILSSLCESDLHRKELFGNQGVDVCIGYLKTDSRLLTSGLGYHKLLLATIDCVWCAMVGCYMNEDYFLEREGVFLLLDLLEECPRNMHNLTLGCLLDLGENAKTIPHINAWRGKKDVSAAHLFCEIWRAEERLLGVQRDTAGTILDTRHPLMGRLQEAQGVISLPATCPSQAIVDVSENMRAKIYAIFCKIGFIELPGLRTEDHVCLTIIEHYLDFKLGEVWSEVAQELEQENVRPVTPDREAVEAICRTVEDRAEHVLSVQRELLDAQNQQDLIDEQEHYAEIRENHRQKEKSLKNFDDYVSRTSNYVLLRAAKERQELSIDASRVQTNYKSSDHFHTTDLPGLQSTCFPCNAGPDDCYELESIPCSLPDDYDEISNENVPLCLSGRPSIFHTPHNHGCIVHSHGNNVRHLGNITAQGCLYDHFESPRVHIDLESQASSSISDYSVDDLSHKNFDSHVSPSVVVTTSQFLNLIKLSAVSNGECTYGKHVFRINISPLSSESDSDNGEDCAFALRACTFPHTDDLSEDSDNDELLSQPGVTQWDYSNDNNNTNNNNNNNSSDSESDVSEDSDEFSIDVEITSLSSMCDDLPSLKDACIDENSCVSHDAASSANSSADYSSVDEDMINRVALLNQNHVLMAESLGTLDLMPNDVQTSLIAVIDEDGSKDEVLVHEEKTDSEVPDEVISTVDEVLATSKMKVDAKKIQPDREHSGKNEEDDIESGDKLTEQGNRVESDDAEVISNQTSGTEEVQRSEVIYKHADSVVDVSQAEVCSKHSGSTEDIAISEITTEIPGTLCPCKCLSMPIYLPDLANNIILPHDHNSLLNFKRSVSIDSDSICCANKSAQAMPTKLPAVPQHRSSHSKESKKTSSHTVHVRQQESNWRLLCKEIQRVNSMRKLSSYSTSQNQLDAVFNRSADTIRETAESGQGEGEMLDQLFDDVASCSLCSECRKQAEQPKEKLKPTLIIQPKPLSHRHMSNASPQIAPAYPSYPLIVPCSSPQSGTNQDVRFDDVMETYKDEDEAREENERSDTIRPQKKPLTPGKVTIRTVTPRECGLLEDQTSMTCASASKRVMTPISPGTSSSYLRSMQLSRGEATEEVFMCMGSSVHPKVRICHSDGRLLAASSNRSDVYKLNSQQSPNLFSMVDLWSSLTHNKARPSSVHRMLNAMCPFCKSDTATCRGGHHNNKVESKPHTGEASDMRNIQKQSPNVLSRNGGQKFIVNHEYLVCLVQKGYTWDVLTETYVCSEHCDLPNRQYIPCLSATRPAPSDRRSQPSITPNSPIQPGHARVTKPPYNSPRLTNANRAKVTGMPEMKEARKRLLPRRNMWIRRHNPSVSRRAEDGTCHLSGLGNRTRRENLNTRLQGLLKLALIHSDTDTYSAGDMWGWRALPRT